MVQTDKVQRIRQEWERRGKPACDHARIDKEYYLGSQTGDVACLDCGETWPRTQAPASRAGTQPPPKP